MKTLVINRHCNYSKISATKQRPSWFSREDCFLSVYRELIHKKNIELLVLFDGKVSDDHFLNKYPVKIIEESCGSGSESYKKGLDLAIANNPDYVYFVEDDYIHKTGWSDILNEGLSENFDYITLYDHPDKYTRLYEDLQSRLCVTKSIHWRSVPSTTDTFACKIQTLKDDLEIHRHFSSLSYYSFDHQRFLELGKRGRTIMSTVPGFSTHVESANLAPCNIWSKE
jgi:hypothetical protein